MTTDGSQVYGPGTNPLVTSSEGLLEAIDSFSLKTLYVRHSLSANQTATFTPAIIDSTEAYLLVSIDKPAQSPLYS